MSSRTEPTGSATRPAGRGVAQPQDQAARWSSPAIDELDWADVNDQLARDGIARTPQLLSPEQCARMIDMFDVEDGTFRSTIVMARHAYGDGRYRYFADPLPPLVQDLRSQLYPSLARIANRWAGLLGDRTFPEQLTQLVEECARSGQRRPTPLLLQYGPGGYNCLHQDVYGDLTFPLQIAIMLSRPGSDFSGGENVFVEQRPRAQSRAIVANPDLGEGLIFPVRHRPVPGARGYRRVAMRHGVSSVHAGQRYVLGIIFHNAA